MGHSGDQVTAAASIPAGRLQGRGAPRVLRRCRDPQGVRPRSSVSQDWMRCQARMGRERSWLSRGPALPDVRGYTIQCRQGAGSSTGVSVTRALLWLQGNTYRNGDSPALCWASLTKTRGGSEGSLALPRKHFGGDKIGSLVPAEQRGSSLLAPGERSASGI